MSIEESVCELCVLTSLHNHRETNTPWTMIHGDAVQYTPLRIISTLHLGFPVKLNEVMNL
jgi:hypothetical protein